MSWMHKRNYQEYNSDTTLFLQKKKLQHNVITVYLTPVTASPRPHTGACAMRSEKPKYDFS